MVERQPFSDAALEKAMNGSSGAVPCVHVSGLCFALFVMKENKSCASYN